MALWRPPAGCSKPPNVTEWTASSRIAVRAWAERARQADQRKRIIWCRTLAPSTVSGTGGKAVSTTVSGVMPLIIGKHAAARWLRDASPRPFPPIPDRRRPANRPTAAPSGVPSIGTGAALPARHFYAPPTPSEPPRGGRRWSSPDVERGAESLPGRTGLSRPAAPRRALRLRRGYRPPPTGRGNDRGGSGRRSVA